MPTGPECITTGCFKKKMFLKITKINVFIFLPHEHSKHQTVPHDINPHRYKYHSISAQILIYCHVILHLNVTLCSTFHPVGLKQRLCFSACLSWYVKHLTAPNMSAACVCVCLPDDLHQLAHVDVVGYQELGFVQNRQLLLSLISLNDHLQQHKHTVKLHIFYMFHYFAGIFVYLLSC